MRLTLELLRPSHSPVRAEVVTYALQYNLPEFAPGQTIQVKYDPEDPSRVAVIEADTRGRR